MGILLGAAGKYWSFVSAREKEEELLFRGNQYRVAIERYYTALPGRQVLPPNIEVLLKDERFPTHRRHLRRQYKDPITGEEFVLIRDMLRGNGIVGVKSGSDKKPIRQKNFPDLYREFEGKEKYSEWEFKYLSPTTGTAVLPGGGQMPRAPGQPLLPGGQQQRPLLPGMRR